MTANKGAKKDRKEIKAQTKFVVTREFGGTQTMQQAFEQLIEKKTEEHFKECSAFPKKGQAGGLRQIKEIC